VDGAWFSAQLIELPEIDALLFAVVDQS